MKKIFLLIMVCCFCTSLIAQRIIKGTVKDGSDNSPLPGVSVAIKGTNRGTVTDVDGQFSLSLQSGDKDLTFSFLGMKTQTIAIGYKAVIDVVMTTDETMLNEVVITSLNISRSTRSLPFAQQQVDAEKMAEVKDQNIVSSLAGKIAGVIVTPPTSSTGSARIVIRGNSSFTGNNQPLFVIDGMQIDNSDGSTQVNKNGGLDFGNGISDIASDDIESISILKGPNASALYGSKAANGVIIITTKKAKDGRFKVSLSSNTMFRYISQWPDFQNAFGVGHMSQMIGGNRDVIVTEDANGNPYPYPGLPSMEQMLNRWNRSNGGPQIGQPYIGLDGLIHNYSPQPDNVYGFYQKASTYTNNIAVEGGNIDNNYRLSLTNFQADDVVETQNIVNRNTLSLRFFNTLIKNVTLDSKVTLTDDNTKNRRYANQSSFNPLYMYVLMPRTMTLDQLKYYKTDAGRETARVGDTHNPYWIMNETHNEDTRTRVLANFDLSYQILPSLRASVKYAREFNTLRQNEFRNKGALGSSQDLNGFYSEQMNRTNNETYEWMFSYNERFFKNLSVLGTLGGSQQNYNHYWSKGELQTLKQAGFAHLSNSNDPPRADEGGPFRRRINALYGSASFGFKDFIYLDLTGRNDWSSTLPMNNNSYFYPSVGFSFIPTEILNISNHLAFVKLRASFAQVGNDTDAYKLKTYYNLNASNAFGGYKYVSIDGVLANANLKPETTRSYEYGADLRFLDGRINADITYYKSNSFDQIVEAAMAPTSGFSRKMYNSGEIENKGWEVSTNIVPFDRKRFRWNFDINFSHYESMVKSMVTESGEIEVSEVFSMKNKVKVGYPYASLFGTVWLTDQQGRRMVNLSNGEPVRRENVYLGNYNPKYMLSFGNNFRYRDFEFYVLIDTKKGGSLYSGTRRQSIRNGVITGLETSHEAYWKREVIFGDIGDYRWGGVQFNENGTISFTNQNIYYYRPDMYDNIENMNPVDPNYVPEQCTRYFWPGNVGYYADGYDNLIIYDASFVKLREVSIGYNLPKKLIAHAKMSNARLSIVGRNLWIFYQKTPKGLDPEAALNAGNGQGAESGSLPPTTTLGFDIKISF